MKEIRIHGRGGQGNVLAAELLSLAAFADGRHVQGFPAFGSERTGSPVQAFVRLDDRPIRRRNQIYEPDVVIVQDATLLRTVDVIAGLRPNGLLILNAEAPPDDLLAGTTARIVSVPATTIALEVIGKAIPNTALLGAFVAATGDVSFEALSEAIRERLGARRPEQNIEAARRARDLVQQAPLVNGTGHAPAPRPVSTNGVRPIPLAGVMDPGASRGYLTGGWRTERPSFLYQKCNGCDLCVVYCPEGIVRAESKNRYVADFDFCKGCGICAEECPRDDIVMVREES